MPKAAQQQFLRVVNSALKDGDTEESAFAQAWGVIKRRWKKNKAGKWVRRTDNMGEFFLVPQAELADKSLLFPFSKGIYFPNGEFTRADGEELVANFDNNVLERKNGALPINPEHEHAAGKIGNVVSLEIGDDGVYGVYEWDDSEKAKKFDYTSAEIRWEWIHPYTGKQYKNVLMGVGATNYPKLLGGTAIASFAEDETWEWAEPETELEPYPIESALYELPRINDTISMLRWLTNIDGLQESAASAMEAMKPIAHTLIDAFSNEQEKEETPKPAGDRHQFGSSAYLVVPDADEPSTWKIRVEETPGRVTVAQLNRAAEDLEASEGKKAGTKERLVALYREHGVEKEDIPEYLFTEEGNQMSEEINQEELAKSVAEHIRDFLGLGKKEEIKVEPDPVPDGDFAEKMTELEERLRNEFNEQMQAKDTEIQALTEAKGQVEAQATQLTEKLAEEEAQRRLAEFNEKATGLQVPVEGFGAILMYFHDADDSEDKARYNQVVAVIEAVKNQVDMAKLFSESGSDGEGSSTEAQLEALVKQRMAETNESYGDAYSAVIGAHRELYKQYNEENVKSVSQSAGSGEGVTYVA